MHRGSLGSANVADILFPTPKLFSVRRCSAQAHRRPHAAAPGRTPALFPEFGRGPALILEALPGARAPATPPPLVGVWVFSEDPLDVS